MKLKRGKKTGLKYFSYADIQSWGPCYNSNKHIGESWRGTAVDILNMDNIFFADRLWCILRTDICSERLMRLAAVWFYRDTLNWIKNPDPRSIEAANVAERFANGLATRDELSAAWSAANSAAWSAANSAAESAAESAARSAESAAWSAAESAAESAAWSAESAAWSAAWSAESAAWSAAENRYKDKLIEMLIIEGKERVKGF